MFRKIFFAWVVAVQAVVVASPTWGQSITTDGNIETDGQLVSNVATGTAPLAVSSTTRVPSLNADQVDGLEGAELALDADLQSAESMLMALQAQMDALGLARVQRTGQSAFDEPGDDGDLQLGVTWPNPRFTINEVSPGVPDGTVTDNLTGLIWLANASCFGQQSWSNALAKAAALFDGCATCGGTDNDCGLQDGSIAGQWRLPNVRELQSLIHYGVHDPAVPDTSGTGQWSVGDPFSGVQTNTYWSSTTYAVTSGNAWVVLLDLGHVGQDVKGSERYVWPVRGGQ